MTRVYNWKQMGGITDKFAGCPATGTSSSVPGNHSSRWLVPLTPPPTPQKKKKKRRRKKEEDNKIKKQEKRRRSKSIVHGGCSSVMMMDKRARKLLMTWVVSGAAWFTSPTLPHPHPLCRGDIAYGRTFHFRHQ